MAALLTEDVGLYRMIGEDFHHQLHELMVEDDPHPDDDTHNIVVGAALVEGIAKQRPEMGVRMYNCWARKAGYVPLTLLGDGPDYIIDIQIARIKVDQNYRVALA